MPDLLLLLCRYALACALLLTLSACRSRNAEWYHLASDFDPTQKIYLVYIPQPYIVELISTLSQHEQVGVFVQKVEEIATVAATLEAAQAKLDHLSFAVLTGVDQWIRDAGPAILKNKNGQLQAVEFLSPRPIFDGNDRAIAQGLGLALRSSQIKAVGGVRESNGEGTIILTKSFFRAVDSAFDQAQVEADLRANYGAERIIWLEEGLIEDELFEHGPVYADIYPIGTGGHTDELCRFVAPRTVLLAEVEATDLPKHPLYQVNHDRLEANYRTLKQAGSPRLDIVRVPAAEFLFETIKHPATGQTHRVVLTASYLNFVIGNHVILAPKYHLPGLPPSILAKAERMRRILQAQFPDHEIVQLDPRRLNARGGGFHCVTFNLPDQKPIPPQKRRRRRTS